MQLIQKAAKMTITNYHGEAGISKVFCITQSKRANYVIFL